jgi:hypothetical protein
LFYEIAGYFFDQHATDPIPTVPRINPDSFEERDWLGCASIGVLTYAYLGKAAGYVVRQ